MFRIQSSYNGKNRKPSGNLLAGIFLLIIGGVLLLRQLDFYFPDWLFRWPMILVVVGLFIGVFNRFRDFGWLILCGVGFFFLADDIWPGIQFRDFIWPSIIIIVGLALLIRSRHANALRKSSEPAEPEAGNHTVETGETYNRPEGEYKEDLLDMVSVFGGIKKNVLSKRFLGGEIVAIFGGAEVNLMQADMQNTVVIEVVQIFGGTTLYVPSNWQIRSELAAIFGGIEDKRRDVVYENPERVLVLDGFTMFGGIEIKSR